ncbi:unnamed protein product [marine sediment metagenome]|uniref:PDZ domain-containing protein n=1 Tax=marine sediment metagenome TaxID=412755 RepID=X1A0I5_9ZZZZ
MEMGKIAAVQQDSEAARLGIQPGDFIDKFSIDNSLSESTAANDPFDDPVDAPELLRQLAEEDGRVRLTVRRSSAGSNGRQSTDEIDVPLRKVTWLSDIVGENDPLDAPALGIAYRVLNRVAEVRPDSPAALAGLQSRDMITKAEFILPKDAKRGSKASPQLELAWVLIQRNAIRERSGRPERFR